MLAALAQKRQAVEVSQIRELGDKRGAILKELKAEEEKVKMVCLSLALPCLSPALAPAWPDACMCVCVCAASILGRQTRRSEEALVDRHELGTGPT